MPAAPAPLADLFAPDDLLAVLEVSLTAIHLVSPVYGPGGEVADFSLDYLNPAGQRLAGLPERPGGTVLVHFPQAVASGVFAYYRRVFETGEALPYEAHYQADGLDGYFRFAARRSGARLVVSFTDATTDRTAAEEVLRASQVRERTALAAAERERSLLQAVLAQAPVAIGLFQGEAHVVAMANDRTCAMWGRSAAQVLGRPLLEGVPELRGQGFDALLADVARTQVPFVGTEVPAQLLQAGRLETHYFNFVYQPLLGSGGEVLGVLDLAVDVTEQVLARQQVQSLNDELQASNDELLRSSEDLLHIQQQVEQLHRAAEERVVERTRDAVAARAEAEHQRTRLERLFAEAPAGICLLDGPGLVFELVNPGYQQLFPGRKLLGLPVLQALPELLGQPVPAMLRGVYETGVTFEGREVLIQLARPGEETLEDRYFNFSYQARYDEAARIDGLVVFAFEVTEQVRARQQVEQLNQALEARVAERTAEAQAARAEAEAQRGELQRVFEQAPVAIAAYRGPNYVIELANPMVCALWGRTPAQALHTPLFTLLPETAGQGYEQLLDEVMATGVPHVAHEMPAVHDRNGRRETVYWNFVYQPLRAADGQITGALVVANDVTESVLARRQVEQLNQELETRVAERTQQLAAALEEAQQQRRHVTAQQRLLSQIIGQVPAAIATLAGPEHRYSFFNDGYQALSGHRTQLGHTVAEVFPEVVAQGFVGLLDEVYATGRPFSGREMPAQLFDPATSQPELRYVDFIYQPLLDGEGQAQGVLAFIVDVTDKVLARQHAEALQAELLAAAQRQVQVRDTFYQIFEQTPAAVCIQRGPEHRYEYANAAYQAFFPGRELLGQPVAGALPETVDGGVVALLDHVYQTGETYFGHELPLLVAQPNGAPPRQMYFTFTYQAYRENGEIVGISTFAYDVAEQVLARQQVQVLNEELQAINDELRDTNQQLTRTNVDLDNFVYTASHDLKAPITNIEGILLALRQYLPAEVQQQELVAHLLELLQAAVERFQLTIAQLTDIARLQQAHDQPAEAVALAAVVEAVRLDLAAVLAAADAQFTVAVAPDLHVSFAPKNLRSLVYNLLSNAVKYRHPDRAPQVQLRAHRTDAAVVLEVQDNGLGLSKAQQGQLFGIFRRLHTHVEGSGVGLYMVKRMVENAGGTIAVQSQPGIGTTFTVTFPA